MVHNESANAKRPGTKCGWSNMNSNNPGEPFRSDYGVVNRQRGTVDMESTQIWLDVYTMTFTLENHS